MKAKLLIFTLIINVIVSFGQDIYTTNGDSILLQLSNLATNSSLKLNENSQSNLDVMIKKEDNYLVFYSYGDLIGLNVFLNDNFNALGTPLTENGWIMAANITPTVYSIGLMLLNSASDGSVIMRIPILNAVNGLKIYLNINGVDKVCEIDLISGLIKNSVENIKHQIRFYPNPVKDYVTIETPFAESEKFNLIITNTLGQMLFLEPINNHILKINMSDLIREKGIYNVLIINKQSKVICQTKILYNHSL